jgi:hypothetical protein
MIPHYNFFAGAFARDTAVGITVITAMLCVAVLAFLAIIQAIRSRDPRPAAARYDAVAHTGYLIFLYCIGYRGINHPYAHQLLYHPIFQVGHVMIDLSLGTIFFLVVSMLVRIVTKTHSSLAPWSSLGIVCTLTSLFIVIGLALILLTPM